MKTMTPSKLEGDFHRYVQIALEAGMTEAQVIPASTIIIDTRVPLKCRYPRCSHYGTNANCPPFAIDTERMSQVVASYSYAIIMRKRFASEELLCKSGEQTTPRSGMQKCMYDTVSLIESAAFHDGNILAMGFANGPCKRVFCPDIPCSAIIPGGTCRFPLRSRSSMEAVGMNVFAMAKALGWDMQPAGRSSTPATVPYLSNIGIVLID